MPPRAARRDSGVLYALVLGGASESVAATAAEKAPAPNPSMRCAER